MVTSMVLDFPVPGSILRNDSVAGSSVAETLVAAARFRTPPPMFIGLVVPRLAARVAVSTSALLIIADLPGALRVPDLRRERAGAAVDHDDVAGEGSAGHGGAGPGGAGGIGRVAPVRKRRGDGRAEAAEVADGSGKRRRSDHDWDPEEVIVRRGAGRDRARGLAGTLDRVHPGPGVAGRDRDHYARLGGAVAGDRELVLEAVDAAAEAHVDHVHAVLDGVLDSLRDVVRRRVRRLPREHVVVSEERLGSDAAEAVDRGSAGGCGRGRAVHARDGAGDVRAVVLERLRR